MGFYDTRCMVTGLNLRVMDAALVPLVPDGHRYVPVTLAPHGAENGYGVVDGVEDDANSALVFGYFLDRMRDGRARRDYADVPLLGPVLDAYADRWADELAEAA
ncbi:MAG TPA: hypothetical protein VGN37_11375 [Actinocatenispora sp.]